MIFNDSRFRSMTYYLLKLDQAVCHNQVSPVENSKTNVKFIFLNHHNLNTCTTSNVWLSNESYT